MEGPGQFSLRGGLLDIYPLAAEQPCRIEFFDTEVDSIRFFDPLSQRSLEPIDTAEISPAGELILSGEQRQAGITAILENAETFASKLSAPAARARLMEKAERLRAGLTGSMEGLEAYFPFFLSRSGHHLILPWGRRAFSYLMSPAASMSGWRTGSTSFRNISRKLLGRGEVLPDQAYNHLPYAALQAQSAGHGCVIMQSLIRGIEGFSLDHLQSVTSRTIASYHRSIKLLADDIAYWKKKEIQGAVVCR